MSQGDGNLVQARREIVALTQRIDFLERMKRDLQLRVENQDHHYMEIGQDLSEIQKDCSEKSQTLYKEIKRWKDDCATKKLKNDRLREQVKGNSVVSRTAHN